MSNYTAGFVGAGHMGSILAGVAIKSIGGDKVVVACSTDERSKAKAKNLGCQWDVKDVVITDSNFVFLGVRPKNLEEIVTDNKATFDNAQGIIVSMLAGVSISRLEELLGQEKKIIRIMPNTPSEVGEGIIAYACNKNVAKTEIEAFVQMMAPAGMVDEIDEPKMDIFSVIAACAPAYAYYFADALARGGAEEGLDKEKAIAYVAQMLRGSAKMIMETGKSPEVLKDEVCTPGGTTIEGIKVMEAGQMDMNIMAAVKASYDKTVGKMK